MKEELLSNIDKIHTTTLGMKRIEKNLKIKDVIDYVKDKIKDENSNIYKKGKNWYIENNCVKITVNSKTYTIITAHKKENKK